MESSREQRIMTLATTLKSSGIAKSEAQARMMAEDMIGVEEHVQKSYEEKHAQAHDYLQTTKNLGTPRKKAEPIPQRPTVRTEGTRLVEPIPMKADTESQFKGKTLDQAYAQAQTDSHDTKNAALEAIKAEAIKVEIAREKSEQISSEQILDTDDVMPLKETDVKSLKTDLDIMKDVDDLLEEPVAPSVMSQPSENDVEQSVSESIELTQEHTVQVSEPKTTTLETETLETETLEQTSQPEPAKLDSAKLVELMEEDGKLEEHTREIKEKPTNVKPKEEYVENGIDLANVFNFNKR